MFGQEIQGLLDILKNGWKADKNASKNKISNVLSLTEYLELMTELVEEHMSETPQKQKSGMIDLLR